MKCSGLAPLPLRLVAPLAEGAAVWGLVAGSATARTTTDLAAEERFTGVAVLQRCTSISVSCVPV